MNWKCTGLRGKPEKLKICTRRKNCERWVAGSTVDARLIQNGGDTYPCLYFIRLKAPTHAIKP